MADKIEVNAEHYIELQEHYLILASFSRMVLAQAKKKGWNSDKKSVIRPVILTITEDHLAEIAQVLEKPQEG